MKENRGEKLDQLFKENLDAYESPYSEKLWDAIGSEISKTDEKPVTGSKWSLMAIPLFLISFFVYEATNNENVAASSIIEANEVHLREESPVKYDKVEISAESQNKNTVSTRGATITTEQIKQSTELSSENRVINTKKQKQELKNSVVPVSKKIKKQEDYKNIIASIADDQQKNKEKILTPNIERQQASFNKKEESIGLAISNEMANSSSLKDYNQLSPVVPLLSKFPRFNINLFSKTDPSRCAKFNLKHKVRRYFDAFISLDHSQKLFRPASNEEWVGDYAEVRKESESHFYTFSAGGRFSIVNHKGLAFRTGLVYTQINEIIDHTKVNDIRNDIIGEWILLYYNRYRLVDIPLMLGYEMDKGKITWAINGGVQANLLFLKKGFIFSPPPNVRPIAFDPSTPTSNNEYADVYKDRAGLSLIGSIGMYYHMNYNMEFMLEPQFMYQLQSITLDSHPLEQRYLDIGMKAGVRVAF